MATRMTTKPVQLNYRQFIYYLGKDGHVWSSSKQGGQKQRVGAEKVERNPKYIYWVGSDGFVYSKQR